MAVPQPVSLLIPLEERFCVLLKPELPFGQLLALKRGHTWPVHPVDKIPQTTKTWPGFAKLSAESMKLEKTGVFAETWLPEWENGGVPGMSPSESAKRKSTAFSQAFCSSLYVGVVRYLPDLYAKSSSVSVGGNPGF